jgi:hypothetical protein
MKNTVKREKEGKATGIKKPYHPPSLVCYGAIKDLTRGGSMNAREASQSSKIRP